jgi:Bacterial PH domain
MSYVEKNLLPGETLIYQTRHHWVVLLGPLVVGFLLGIPGFVLLAESIERKSGRSFIPIDASVGPGAFAIAGLVLLVVAIATRAYGQTKRNATEMAVTNRRVLIKTGLGSRRTLDLMLSRVESIGVEETVWGRMLGYGSVIVRGTGGTPDPFVMIAHPQEFRRAVQEQCGLEGRAPAPAVRS